MMHKEKKDKEEGAISTQDKLNQLDQDIRKVLKTLTSKQRVYCQNIAKGENKEQSALKAGYAKSTARSQAHNLYSNLSVIRAIELMQYQNQLKHGIDADVKRDILLDVARRHAESNPRAVVAAINELNRMDGGHKPITNINVSSTSVSISYDLSMPERVKVIDHEE